MHNDAMGHSRLTPLAHALAALAALGSAAALPAQRAVEHAIEFSTGQDDNLFSVLRSQDHIHSFEKGLAEIDAGELRNGVERLHRLLQADNGGVVPVAPGRFLGLRLCTIVAMANMSPAAKAEYEELVKREGGAVERLHELTDEQLALLADRFPAASIGLRARLRLGDLALTAGNGRVAAEQFRQALDATEIGSTDERRARERLRCARVLQDPFQALADREGRDQTIAGDELLPILPTSDNGRCWPAYGGGHGGDTPMLSPIGRLERSWAADVTAPGFDARDAGNFAMHAVGDLDGIFVNTGRRVVAFAPLRKEVAWETPEPMHDAPEDSPRYGRWRGSTGEGINEDMVLAAACNDDVVVAALQVPDKTSHVDFHGGLVVINKIPMRRLYGFARQSGKLLWSHYDSLDGPRTRGFRGHDACANPLIAGDTVYCPVHDRSGAIAFSIGAYDVRTGAPKWRRLVCSSQQDVNMFGNARAEFAASPLCLRDGVLYGASNLGVAFALDASNGRLRWLTAYDVVSIPKTSFPTHHQQDRLVYFANNAPAIADDVVCTTPLDSPFVLGFDTESGRLLWHLPPEASIDTVDNRVVWLAGTLRDEFVLAGNGAVAVKARPHGNQPGGAVLRQLVRPEQLGDRRSGLPLARPAVTREGVWFARADALLGFDAAGQPLASSPARLPRTLPGNLTLVAGIAVSLRQHTIELDYDAAALRSQIEADAMSHPDDPALLLRLANLQHALQADDDPRARAALANIYREGLAVAQRTGLAKNHPVRQALQRELYRLALLDADQAVQRGAPDAIALLVAARDAAADENDWLHVQAMLLARCTDDRAMFATELERLATEAPDATFPFGEGVPVRTWVAWQRARLATDPAKAVELWQDLIENHGDRALGGTTAARLARDAIAALIAQHGPACYAAVRARADQALAAAGDDRQALAGVTLRFPNSEAAERARVRLLDAAVRAGDLTIACSVLAQGLAAGSVPPGIARRVLVAAAQRGNQGLARAMADRLRAHGKLASDWPDDQGRTYDDVLAALPQPAAVTLLALQVPASEVVACRGRSPNEFSLFNTVLVPPGFSAPADVPLYVKADAERQLRAIDVRAATADKPLLFAAEVEYSTQIVLCGTVLIVPDLRRVFALDYRTGRLLWELPNGKRRLIDSLGVCNGVLHVTAQPETADGDGELLGIEPLTGVVLFSRPLPAQALRPKAIDGALLQMQVTNDGSAIVESIDPVAGTAVQATTITAAVLQNEIQLQPESMLTRFFPQWLASDGERVYLPVDSSPAGDAPRLLALQRDGKVAWHWRGSSGAQLVLAALRGDRFVVIEASERKPARLVLLRATDGEVLRTVDAGFDATVLDWERSSLSNPAPAACAIESFADAERTQRQFLCVGVADDVPTFALPLGREDGEIVREPLFGADFVTFATRPGKGAGGGRLWCVSLADRSGLLPDGRKYRLLTEPGGVDAMARVGENAAVLGAQGILILGPAGDKR
jgi:outer membrane protein assembly factor BamB